MEEDDQEQPPRWRDEPGPTAKALGWGCLAALLLPLIYLVYFVATFCENDCTPR